MQKTSVQSRRSSVQSRRSSNLSDNQVRRQSSTDSTNHLVKDSDSPGAYEKGADKPPSRSSQQDEYLTGVIEGEATSDTEVPPGEGEKEATKMVVEPSMSAKRRSSTKSSTSEQGLLKPSAVICVNVI